MDFTHTEDRRMLADSLRRYLSEQYDIDTRIKVAYEAPYHAPDKWHEMAELGILSALVSEGASGGDKEAGNVFFEHLEMIQKQS